MSLIPRPFHEVITSQSGHREMKKWVNSRRKSTAQVLVQPVAHVVHVQQPPAVVLFLMDNKVTQLSRFTIVAVQDCLTQTSEPRSGDAAMRGKIRHLPAPLARAAQPGARRARDGEPRPAGVEYRGAAGRSTRARSVRSRRSFHPASPRCGG
jgi:hypothetical protein